MTDAAVHNDGSEPFVSRGERFDANLTATFEIICEYAQKMIGADHSGFVRFDPLNEAGEVVAEYPLLGLVGRRLRLRGVQAEEHLLEHDEPLVINDVDAAHDLGDVQHLLQQYEIKSLCVVKVRFHDLVIGSLSLDWIATKRVFSEEQIELCRLFAEFASIMIEARQLAEWMESFHGATVAVTSERRVDSLLRTIVEQAKRLFNTRKVGLYERRPDNQGLDTLWLVACSEPEIEGKRLAKKTEGMAWQLTLSNLPFMSTVDYDAYVYRAPEYEGVFGSVLEVPLVRTGERIGVIYLSDVRGRLFTDFDAGLLRHFADIATIALQHMTLVDRMRTLSVSAADISANFDSEPLDVRLRSIAFHTADILKAEMCGVFLLDRSGMLRLNASHGHREDEPIRSEPFDILDEPHSGFTGAIFARLLTKHSEMQSAFAEESVARDEAIAFNSWGSALHNDSAVKGENDVSPSGRCFSLLAMPLIKRDQNRETVVGMLRISNKKGIDGAPADAIHFNDEDVWVLRIFTEAVVVAIQGARLFESLQRQKDLANALAGDAPLGERLTQVAKSVVAMTDRSFCRVLLADESEGFLTVRAAELHPDLAGSVQWNPEGLHRSPISAWPHLQKALALGTPYELNASDEDQHQILSQLSGLFDVREQGKPMQISALFGVPMTIGGRIAGLLSVGHLERDGEAAPFTDEQRHYIAAIAAQATITIDREWRPLEIERVGKQRVETLKYLAIHYIKCGVVFHNHHSQVLTLLQWVQALEKDAVNEKVSPVMLDDIQWTRRSVETLFDVIVAAPLSFEVPPVRELNEVIRIWTEGLRADKDWQQIEFRVYLEATQGVTIRLDADLLGEVFLIFAKNARSELLEMPEKRERKFSIATSIDDRARIVISFTDTGRGINSAKLERIRKELRTGVTEHRERGLGLVTAQLVMTHFGGEVLEPQSSDQGAAFTIVLPQGMSPA
jgi:GAF domain-containing protein